MNHDIDRHASAPDGPPVVFVADADLCVRHSLDALTGFGGWRTEGFSCAQELLERPRYAGPSCMVLDLDLPQLDGLALQRRIATDRREMPVVFVTGRADVPVAVEAMKAGAVDFLTKPVRHQSLLQAVEASLSRSRATLSHARALQAAQARHATLSRREQEVMALVVSGLLNKQVAGELGISEITVKAHRGSVMRKMAARSLPALVDMARLLRDAGPPQPSAMNRSARAAS